MDQHRCIGIQGLEILKPAILELFMDDAGTIPEQHISARGFLNVVPQVLVRRPENFLAAGVEVFNNCLGTA